MYTMKQWSSKFVCFFLNEDDKHVTTCKELKKKWYKMSVVNNKRVKGRVVKVVSTMWRKTCYHGDSLVA